MVQDYRQLFNMTGTTGAGDPYAQAGGEGGGAATRDPNFEYTPTGSTDAPQYNTEWKPQDDFLQSLQQEQSVGYTPRTEGQNNPSFQFDDNLLPKTHGMSFSQMAPVGAGTKLYHDDYQFNDPNYGQVTDKRNVDLNENMFEKMLPYAIMAGLTFGGGAAISAVAGAGGLGASGGGFLDSFLSPQNLMKIPGQVQRAENSGGTSLLSGTLPSILRGLYVPGGKG